jgi:hypothetical protein
MQTNELPGVNATLTIRRRSAGIVREKRYPARVIRRGRDTVIVEYINEAGIIERRAAYESQVQVHA